MVCMQNTPLAPSLLCLQSKPSAHRTRYNPQAEIMQSQLPQLLVSSHAHDRILQGRHRTKQSAAGGVRVGRGPYRARLHRRNLDADARRARRAGRRQLWRQNGVHETAAADLAVDGGVDHQGVRLDDCERAKQQRRDNKLW